MEPALERVRHRRPHSGSAACYRNLCHGGNALAYRSHPCLGNVRNHHLRTAVLRLQLLVQVLSGQWRRIWAAARLRRYHGLLRRPYHYTLPRRFRPCHCRYQEWSRRADGKESHQAVWKEERERASRLHAHHRRILDVHLQYRHSGHDAHLPHTGVQGPACQRQGTHRANHGHSRRCQPRRYGHTYWHSSKRLRLQGA